MFSLSDYETIVAIIEERHFGRAARRLSVTQPALTSRLKRIEGVVGTALFERDRSGVIPTSAGIAFTEGARRITDLAAETVDRARQAAQGLGETLRIGMTQVAAYGIVPVVLAQFREQQPEARLLLREGTTASLEARLEAREIDVAFLHPPLHASILDEQLLASSQLVRIDATGRLDENTPLVYYPRSEAPVLMGRLGRSLSDNIEPMQGEADTMLGAYVLSRAGYGHCVVEQTYLKSALDRSAGRKASEECGILETSLAWRSDDKRESVELFCTVAKQLTNVSTTPS